MSNLIIRKKSENVFQHFSGTDNFILSDFVCKTDNDNFKIVEISGGGRREYNYLNITVIDDTVGGGVEIFASSLLLMLRLEELRYTGFNWDGTVPDTAIQKLEKLELPITGTGSINVLVNNKTANFLIETGVTEFTGFVFSNEVRDTYDGKKYTLKNGTVLPVLLKHNIGSLQVQLDFPNDTDYILQPNEIIEFIYRKRVGNRMEFVGAVAVAEKPNFNFYQQGRIFSNLFGTNNSGKWLRIFPFAIAEYSDSTGQTDKDLVIPSYESAVFKVPTKCKIIQISKGLSSDLGMLIIKTTNNNGLTPIRIFHLEPATDILEHNAQNDTVINQGDYIHIFYKKVSNANPQSFYILNITFQPL